MSVLKKKKRCDRSMNQQEENFHHLGKERRQKNYRLDSVRQLCGMQCGSGNREGKERHGAVVPKQPVGCSNGTMH